MTTAKQIVQEILDRLPDDVSLEEIRYEVELRRKLEAGLRDLDEGRSTTHEEVRRRFLLRGASIEDLKQVSGILDDESAQQMLEAIEEGCERIDPEGW